MAPFKKENSLSLKNKKILPGSQNRLDEIIKCAKDPTYFINHYVHIQHPLKGLVKFDTYPFQDDCVADFNKYRYNIVLKSRQLGLSTICAAYALWLALFHKDKNILVIATQMSTAQNFITKVRVMFTSLPPWIVITERTTDSTKQLGFSNGSIIKATPTNESAGRSEALSLLVIDEAAHIEKLDELWIGLYSTLSTGGKCIILSTPAGAAGFFHKTWIDAEKKKNEFNTIKLPWDVHPERDEEWFNDQCKNLSKRGIAQELLCSFLASGNSFITIDDISAIEKNCKAPIDRYGPGLDMWIWKFPDGEHKYLIAADVATGAGDDFSAFHVIDMSTSEIVADYRGKMPPDRFAEFLVDVAKKYSDALICNEYNSIGYATSLKLKDLRYPNLYYERPTEGYVLPEEQVGIPGFNTNGKNRTIILSKLEEILRNRKLGVYSIRLCEELKTFIWRGQKPEAQKGYHDDLVMSLAIGCWIFDASEHSKYSEGLGQALLEGMSRSSQTMDNTFGGFGGGNFPALFTTSGLKKPPTNNGQNQNMPRNSQVIINNYFSWVLDENKKQ